MAWTNAARLVVKPGGGMDPAIVEREHANDGVGAQFVVQKVVGRLEGLCAAVRSDVVKDEADQVDGLDRLSAVRAAGSAALAAAGPSSRRTSIPLTKRQERISLLTPSS